MRKLACAWVLACAWALAACGAGSSGSAMASAETSSQGGGATSSGAGTVGASEVGSGNRAGGSASGGGASGGTAAGGSASGVDTGDAAGMQAFPSSAPFYQDISQAPLDQQSDSIMQALSAIGWGDADKRTKLGIDFSFNINLAGGSVARRAFTKSKDFFSPDCDVAPVPLPAGGKGEGVDDYACGGGDDCHLLVYQGNRYYELYQSNITGGMAAGGSFTATCLVLWDLTKDYWAPAVAPNFSRGDGCTGGDAADLPMAPLLLTKADLQSGQIKHALRFTIDNNRIAQKVYVHPATHYGGPSGGSDMLPYGARLRLRPDYPLASLPSDEARVVAKALQTYGMYLADGGNIYISATVDAADVIDSSILGALEPGDFEMLDSGERFTGQDCRRTPITE